MPSPQGSRPATSAMSLPVTLGTHGSWPRNSQLPKLPVPGSSAGGVGPSPGRRRGSGATSCPARSDTGQTWTRVVTSRAQGQSPARQGHRWMLIHVRNT